MSFKIFAGALIGALLLSAPAWANAPPPPPPEARGVAPEIFVQSLYDTKKESEAVSGEFGSAMTDSLILNHFTPELLALFKQAIGIDEPIVDGDIFWDSQEWDPKAEIAYKATAKDATTAQVEAAFKVPGGDRKVVYSLKAFGNGWQIDDIAGGTGSMRKWLAEGIVQAGK